MGRFDDQGRVRAAGAALWRRDAAGLVEVLLIHRPAYDDWTFPKGKRDPGETDEQTTVREIAEEVGLDVVLGKELTSVEYVDGRGRPKLVRYWEVGIDGADPSARNEVDAVEWVAMEAVEGRLTYRHDTEVLAALRRSLTLHS